MGRGYLVSLPVKVIRGKQTGPPGSRACTDRLLIKVTCLLSLNSSERVCQLSMNLQSEEPVPGELLPETGGSGLLCVLQPEQEHPRGSPSCWPPGGFQNPYKAYACLSSLRPSGCLLRHQAPATLALFQPLTARKLLLRPGPSPHCAGWWV